MTTQQTLPEGGLHLGSGTVSAVAVVHKLLVKTWEEPFSTAIDKRPVEGRVLLQRLGLAGDVQCDRKHHGGVHAAVYAYADEDAAWWAAELDREITPGLFGENLRTSGIDVTGAEIGEQWQVGPVGEGVLLEVASPRLPCRTFADRMAEPRWVKRFTVKNAPGAYLRVLEAGSVAAGDEVRVGFRPGHGVTIGDVTAKAAPATMRRLLEAADRLDLTLDPGLRRQAVRVGKRT
jgi:MOSC domain-containing protein YiiM